MRLGVPGAYGAEAREGSGLSLEGWHAQTCGKTWGLGAARCPLSLAAAARRRTRWSGSDTSHHRSGVGRRGGWLASAKAEPRNS